jgi:hypothetical protein
VYGCTFPVRKFLVVWLFFVMMLGAYELYDYRTHVDNRETVDIEPYNYDTSPILDNRETIEVEPYSYGKNNPVSLGEIKNPESAYIRLKLRFRADSVDGYPNVFSTAPFNSGLRMELSGTNASIVVPDSSVSGGWKGFSLTNTLKTKQWYELEVEVLNRKFIKIFLDGQLVANYASTGLSMETSRLLVGGGFDASRAFRGQIEDISITKGNLKYGQNNPVSLGEIKNPESAYIRLKLRFRADSVDGYPNVFSTAPFNSGLRMELSGTNASIVVPDSSVSGGWKGFSLTNTLETKQWYELEVEVLNRKFITIFLDGQLVANYASTGLSMETSSLLVGGGFDASRTFRGQIENISITKGNLKESWAPMCILLGTPDWLHNTFCHSTPGK